MKAKIRQQALTTALLLTVVSFPAFADDIGNLPDILVANLGIVSDIMQTLAILFGLGLFITGMFQLKRYGEMRTMMSAQMSINGPLATILAGVALLFSPLVIGTALVAFWGPTGLTDLAAPSTSTSWGQYTTAVIMFVRLLGIWAFMRGFYLLSRSGQHQGQPVIGKALIHIFAGILCVHIMGTIQLLEGLFGFDFQI